MTVSLRVVSAGAGYRYLLRTVAAGDGDRDFATPLTRYYQERGTPPGRWLGSGLVALDADDIRAGTPVTEEHLRRLIGHGVHPVTGQPLGNPYRGYRTARQRIAERVAALPAGMPDAERQAHVDRIEGEELRQHRSPVAGFDLTFSVPKSLSALWAAADAGTQAVIADLHHAAIGDVLALIERDVAMTRVGTNGVAQVGVDGILATAFDHYDSRAADPQLHTHVVVANRARTTRDGRWRTLDSRALHAAVVAMSEHYNAVLADRTTSVLGLSWELRDRGRDRNPEWELAAVGEPLIDAFSSRSRAIAVETQRLVTDFVATHGRQPGRVQVIKLRQDATLRTRPAKQVRSLADLTDEWRRRATEVLGADSSRWALEVLNRGTARRSLRADDLPVEEIDQLAREVLDAVGARRSTWRRWNLHAEAVRVSRRLSLAGPRDRDELTRRIVDAAELASVQLTPPLAASTPPELRRADGETAFRPRASIRYSSHDILDAEDRLLALAQRGDGPRLSTDGLRTILARPTRRGLVLAEDQLTAVEQVVASGRMLDLLVGPAGAGKTTTLGVMRGAWERRFGRGSVVGLAPSAAAAAVLAADLRIPTENTIKWQFEHARGRWQLRRNQLVIVDEASLAGTLSLDRLAAHAAEVGAKLLLVGDWAQLAAVDTPGGAFAMIAHELKAVPELWDIRRFAADWERTASLALRAGDVEVLDAYQDHGRIVSGPRNDIAEQAYRAWRRDRAAGHRSLLIAQTADLVIALNQHARLDLVLEGVVDEPGTPLHDGTEAGVGDTVISRRNERTLRVGGGWVKNGDRWRVVHRFRDGALTVRRERGRGRVTLPADYVARDLELGYAVTAHRAQGATVDTAHAIVAGGGMHREALYVAMTRGQLGNTVYVATDNADLEEHQQPPHDPDAHAVLARVLDRRGADLSARDTIAAEIEEYDSIARLSAEYDTLALAAQGERWADLLARTPLTPRLVEATLASDAFGVLAAELRRAEANGHDLDRMLPDLVAGRGFDDVGDPAKVLHARLSAATQRPGPRRARPAARLIAGLIPEAAGTLAGPMRDALDERAALMEGRAAGIVQEALAIESEWVRPFGQPPSSQPIRVRWARELRTVAAYRDRYRITSRLPLGTRPRDANDPVEGLDRRRAEDALRRAQSLARDASEAPAALQAPTRQAGPIEL